MIIQRRWGRLIQALTVAGVLLTFIQAQAATPVVSNIRASQRAGTKLVDIYYDVNDADGDPLTVEVAVSSDAGLTWTIPAQTFSGDIGAGVTSGTNRRAVWNAGSDFNGNFIQNCKVRVTAHDGTTPPAPAGMAYIPEGPFQMGDNFLEIGDWARPVHNVYIDAFFIDKHLVSRELWIAVRSWGVANGYQFDYVGIFRDINHPVEKISWYDMVKWCNARSQKEGLTPVYCTDAGLSTIYKSGSLSISNDCVRWSASGYRLPTEAEWEKAARGGLTGCRFPWGNTISHDQANYLSSATYSYDVSPTRGNHPVWGTGSNPVDYFPANGYGLRDMAGNFFQWVWDWYGATYYGTTEACQSNPRGPQTGTIRVLRGGSCVIDPTATRCAWREGCAPGTLNVNYYHWGFRCVRFAQ